MENINTVKYWNDKFKHLLDGTLKGYVAKDFTRWNSVLRGFKGQSILDIGCGLGDFAKTVSERYPDAKVCACDFSDWVIEQCQQQTSRVKFFVSDATRIRDSGKYDLVSAQEILEHLENPRAAIIHWKEFVAPGGTLVITIPLNDAPYAEHVQIFTKESVIELFNSLPFDLHIDAEIIDRPYLHGEQGIFKLSIKQDK